MLLLDEATVCSDRHNAQERCHHTAWGHGAWTVPLGLQGSAAAQHRGSCPNGPRQQRRLSSAQNRPLHMAPLTHTGLDIKLD